ncbi:MAG: hypothetical protein ACXADH_01080 [Candidatus Kariarchaeaceae archaeon]
MEDQNVIILLDKLKKLVELGAKPKAISEIDGTIAILEKNLTKLRGKLFDELHSPMGADGSNDEVLRLKINEFIRWANNRFT